jgi:hypothetical protein
MNKYEILRFTQDDKKLFAEVSVRNQSIFFVGANLVFALTWWANTRFASTG